MYLIDPVKELFGLCESSPEGKASAPVPDITVCELSSAFKVKLPEDVLIVLLLIDNVVPISIPSGSTINFLDSIVPVTLSNFKLFNDNKEFTVKENPDGL